MFDKKNHKNKNNRAQTAIELAVFGGVLIFILGVIVQQSLTFNYQQNQNLKAMRLAMLLSFESSEGLRVHPAAVEAGIGGDGTTGRNTVSVVFVEDRLTSSSGKYGAINRVPQIVSGTATHSRNLLMSVEADEPWNVPIFDMFVNGQHFPFTVAGQRLIPVPIPPPLYFERVPNHPALGYDAGCPIPCFDLDRDGSEDVPGDEKVNFAWQWHTVTFDEIDVERRQKTLLDVDDDLQEETVLLVTDGTLVVMDSQAGDMDFTVGDDAVFAGLPVPKPGLQADQQIFTNTAAGAGVGTYLQIDEGRLFQFSGDGRQYIRTAQKKDSIDLVQRSIQLSNDTGRFCNPATGSPTQAGTPEGIIAGWTDTQPNPVAVCCAGAGCCFSGSNFNQTCMSTNPASVPNYPIIFVRSAIFDGHGRKWVTEVKDHQIIFGN